MTRARAAGFTLTELAIAMVIMGLLLVGAVYTLQAQIEQRNRNDTQRRLDEAKELLLNFAIVNGRLPCPARCSNWPACNVAGDGGDEMPLAGGAMPANGATCFNNYAGYLPGRVIGFQPVDAAGYAIDTWGNRIRYAVSNTTWSAGNAAFTIRHVPNAAMAWSLTQMPADLVVCASSTAAGFNAAAPTCGAGNSVTNQTVAVAVVWSHGKNYTSMPAGNADEQVNNKHRLPLAVNNNAAFVWHDPRPVGAVGGEYDDLMVWLPVGQVYGRMLAAGVLP